MRESLRSRGYTLLGHDEQHSPARTAVSTVLIIAVVLGVSGVLVGSLPELSPGERNLAALFSKLASVVFLAEYLARLWTAPESDPAMRGRPLAARIAYARSFFGIFDLIVLAPVIARFALTVPDDYYAVGAVFALFKLGRYLSALPLVAAVLARQGRSLMAALVTMGVLLVLVSSMMFVLERGAQPDIFKSIPHTMWWAIVTMATVGYGDMAPVTGLGRVFGGFTMLLGIAVFAVPAGILATGFAEELRKRDFVITWHTVAKVPLFAALDATRIAGIARLLKPQIVPANGVIVRRGDPADAMFFIMEGEVQVEVMPTPVRLKPGQFFGEIALLTEGSRTATVTAVKESRLLMLEATEFRKLTTEHPDLRAEMEKVASQRQQPA